MPRPRLNEWLSSDSALRGTPEFRETAILRSTLRSNSPGQWSQNVNELARHFTGATFLAINTIAKHAMDSTFSLHDRGVSEGEATNGEVQLPWHDPAHQFFETPNPVDSFGDQMYQTVQQLCLTGMALEWNPPDENTGDLKESYTLPTANCWPMPISWKYPHGAYRVLPYPFGLMAAPVGQIASGAIIPAEQVTRIKNHHPTLRYDGYAVLTAISQQVDTLEAIDQSRNATMQQGTEQTLALEPVAGYQSTGDPSPEDLARYREQLKVIYAGPKNAGKLFIPFGGYKLSQISTVPRDMAWQEGWSQVLDFVLAAFGVPKAVAGLQDAVSYATLYSSLRAFCLFSLGPIVRQVARARNQQVVWPSWGREITLKINAPEFKDESLEQQKLDTDLKCGAIKIEEYRKIRGYDQLKEAWVKERAYASYNPNGGPGAGGDNPEAGNPQQAESNGPRLEDPNVGNNRPGAKMLTQKERAERLATMLDRAKLNGHAHKIEN